MKILFIILFVFPFVVNGQKIFAINIPGPPPDTIVQSPTDTSTSYVRQHIIKRATFEGANPLDSFYDPPQVCTTCPYGVVVETDTVARGTHGLRFDIYKTDSLFAGSHRAEVYPHVSPEDPLGAERWFGINVYPPSATMGYDLDPDLIVQWHPETSNGSPPFSFRLWKGDWYAVRWTGNDIGTNPDNAAFNYYDLGPYTTDAWNSIVIHYKQASDATGLVEIWINGAKVSNAMLPPNAPNSYPGLKNYLKFGDNKNAWVTGNSWGGNQTHRLYYVDNFYYGNELATFKDVDPNGNY